MFVAKRHLVLLFVIATKLSPIAHRPSPNTSRGASCTVHSLKTGSDRQKMPSDENKRWTSCCSIYLLSLGYLFEKQDLALDYLKTSGRIQAVRPTSRFSHPSTEKKAHRAFQYVHHSRITRMCYTTILHIDFALWNIEKCSFSIRFYIKISLYIWCIFKRNKMIWRPLHFDPSSRSFWWIDITSVALVTRNISD